MIVCSYDKNGNLKGSDSLTSPLPPPIRLPWDFTSSELTKTIGDAYSDALKMIDVSKIEVFRLRSPVFWTLTSRESKKFDQENV